MIGGRGVDAQIRARERCDRRRIPRQTTDAAGTSDGLVGRNGEDSELLLVLMGEGLKVQPLTLEVLLGAAGVKSPRAISACALKGLRWLVVVVVGLAKYLEAGPR